jgi:GNAT superfamily N-acetyltransferase
MIRPATVDDIAAIVGMVWAYQREVRPDLKMHAGCTASSVRRIIQQPQGCAIVADDGPPRGVLLAQMANSLWWPDPSAQVVLWWVAPELRGSRAASAMMDSFEGWAVSLGAARIGANFTGKSARKYFERRGYRYADTSMMKDLT